METTPKRELTLTEIQAREYELLKQFDAYCKRHGLTYCLCGGTLLGAVRHSAAQAVLPVLRVLPSSMA